MEENKFHRLNYFVISFVAILGLTMISEVFMEKEWADRADDLFMVLVGLYSIYWYKTSKAISSRTWMPIILLGLCFLSKVWAIKVEFNDKEAVGDDYGVITALILALIFSVQQLVSMGKKTLKGR